MREEAQAEEPLVDHPMLARGRHRAFLAGAAAVLHPHQLVHQRELDDLVPFVHDRCLTTTGILVTKLHAILDRGARRDFFDLYVTLQRHSLGIAGCFTAMREVFRQDVTETLLLRALTFFDDAKREAALPGEGPDDWATVKDCLLSRVGQLLVPPGRELAIQRRVVDVR